MPADLTGATILYQQIGASGTILNFTVGSTSPVMAAVRLTSPVMPYGAVVVSVRVNAIEQFQLTLSAATITSGGGFRTGTVPIPDVADEIKGLLGTTNPGDVVTFVVISGTMPGSTTITATLYSTLPSKPLNAPGRMDWHKNSPTVASLSTTNWITSPTNVIGQSFGDAATDRNALNNVGQIVKDANGDLYCFGTNTRYGWQSPFSGQQIGKIYGYRLPATPSTAALHTVIAGFSPIAYWKMNETSGTSMLDSSGNSHTGTYSNVTLNQTGFTDGVAAQFNKASSSFASVAIDLSGQSRFLVCVLVNWNNGGGFASDDQLLMEFTANSNTNPGGFRIDPNSSNGNFDIVFCSAGPSVGSGSIPRPSTNGWHLYCFVMVRTQPSPIDPGCATYIDGSNWYFPNTAGSGTFANDILYIGCRAGSALFANMTMQHLAILPIGANTNTPQMVAAIQKACGFTANQWDDLGVVVDLQGGADPVTGLTDQTYYASGAFPFIDNAGNKCLGFTTTDGTVGSGAAAPTRASIKYITSSTSSWGGLLSPTGNAVTIYSNYSGGALPPLANSGGVIVPRPLTNDYLMLWGRTTVSTSDNEGFVAFTKSALTSLVVSDSDYNNAPFVIFNQEENNPSAFVRSGRLYVTATQLSTGPGNQKAIERVYSAPLASADQQTAWIAERRGESFWQESATDWNQDGGVQGSAFGMGFDAGADLLYGIATTICGSTGVPRTAAVYKTAPFTSVFRSTGGATLFVNRRNLGPGCAQPFDVPVLPTSSYAWAFTPTAPFLGGSTIGLPLSTDRFGIILGRDEDKVTLNPLPLQFGLMVTTAGWKLCRYSAAGAETIVASGSSPKFVVGTPITLELDMTPTLAFNALINGSSVATYTVTSGTDGATLVTSLTGTSARWKTYADNGLNANLVDGNTITFNQAGTAPPGSTSLTVSPTTFLAGQLQTIALTGVGTTWTSNDPTTLFSVTGGIGAGISAVVILSDISATATLNPGTQPATLTITDNSNGDTFNVTVNTGNVFTLTGPASGPPGVASGLFTLTPTGPLASNEFISLSDNGLGGTFNPPTMNWLQGDTVGKTFTYTPLNSVTITAIPSVGFPPMVTYAVIGGGGGGFSFVIGG